jgi:hypothetical protein
MTPPVTRSITLRSSGADRPASTSKQTSPVAPAIRNIDRSVEFLDLVTACHSFVAAAGRVVPGLRDRQLGEDERTIVHENVARVRATLDWIETAVDTGKVDVDGGLAKLLPR